MREPRSFEAATAALQARTSYLSELCTLRDHLVEQIYAAVASPAATEDLSQIQGQISKVGDLFAHLENVHALAQDAIAQLTAWISEAERQDANTAASISTARGA